MSAQLVFDLAGPPALGPEDFFVSPANALAVRMLGEPDRWPEGKLILSGPEGSGKTHLSGIWARDHAAEVVQSLSIPDAGDRRAFVVEDVDRLAGDEAAEVALFHLHNNLMAQGGRLLLTARTAPADWGIRLPDLASRLNATARAVLEPPDDALLAAVLVKLFADRQVAVPANVVSYVLPRIDRSFAAVRSFVDRVDERALSAARPVTRALAAEVLGQGARLDSDDRARP